MAKTLTLENALSSDRKPIKIDGESTGLLIGGKDVHIEGESIVGGDVTIVGDMSVKKDTTIIGDTAIGGDISVTGDGVIAGRLAVNGDMITTDGDMFLDSAGNIDLDSHTGYFKASKAGAEFSVANSAYAGMILGYTRLEGDLSSQEQFEIQNSITVEDSTHQITFKTPPSELVEIEATFYINFSSISTSINVGLSDNSTYNSVAVQFEYDSGGHPFSDGEAADGVYKVKWILGASHLASIGSSNTFYVGFGTAGATKTAYLIYGVRSSHGICLHPFVIKATALPATIYDGT